MDAGFIQYLREERGFQPGDTIATKQQYDAMYKQYLKDTSGGGANFQPSAVAITNPVNTNQVVPFVTTSPNSVQPFPQERFKEGPVDKDGQQLVFDPMTGTYFPGTNRATQTVVKPKAKAAPMPIGFGPGGQPFLLPGADGAMGTTNALPDSMALTNVASTAPAGAGAFETNAPVPMGMGMAPTNAASMSMGMAPASAPAATSAAPAMSAAQVKAAFQAKQITREQARQLLGVR
jgi:hypothetical protein